MHAEAKQPVSASLEVVVTRPNGTVVDLGVIAYNHRNPLRRWAWRIGRFIRGRRAGRVKL